MKRFYIILLLSLFSNNAYALIFDKCYYAMGEKFESEIFEKFQFEFFSAEKKVREVIIYTDSALKTGVPKEKINISIFNVTFIDKNYIEAIYIFSDTLDSKVTEKLILYLKDGKVRRTYKEVIKANVPQPKEQSFEINCEIGGSASKSSSGNSNGTFKDILGKYLGK